MTTTDIMELAVEYADESYELRIGSGWNPEPEKALRAAIKALVAERDAALTDAERYRYVRQGNGTWALCYWHEDDAYMDDRWVFDAREVKYVDVAIDAALKGTP